MKFPHQEIIVFWGYVFVCIIVLGSLYAITTIPEDIKSGADKFTMSSKAYNDRITIFDTPNNNTLDTIRITTGAPVLWWNSSWKYRTDINKAARVTPEEIRMWNSSWKYRTDINSSASQLFDGGCWNGTNEDIQIFLTGANNTSTQLKWVCISTEPIIINLSEMSYPYGVLIRINGSKPWSK